MVTVRCDVLLHVLKVKEIPVIMHRYIFEGGELQNPAVRWSVYGGSGLKPSSDNTCCHVGKRDTDRTTHPLDDNNFKNTSITNNTHIRKPFLQKHQKQREAVCDEEQI